MNTKENFVVAISREVGSGGRTVGRRLAERLGVRFSDKELIAGLREQFGLTAERIEQLKGEKRSWFADFVKFAAPMPKAELVVDGGSRYVKEFEVRVTSEDIYRAEVEIIRAIADQGACVMAGRSASFVLKDFPNKLSVFITASRERRIERVMQRQQLTEAQAEAVVDGVDRARENFVRRFTGQSRYDLRGYDLVIDMDQLADEDAAVEVIMKFIECNG
ncbi:MAG: cytidylate kinase-like family protein [Bacteroidales bacterium]|nr:cytidylate kinase-like family protein [Bacteroidales bacterium]